MLAVILAGDTLASARTTFLVAASAYLGVGMVLFAVTAGVRTGVRTMTVILLAGDIDEPDRRRYAQWELLVDLLTRADHMLEAGAVDATQHEALWWQAYDRIEVPAHV